MKIAVIGLGSMGKRRIRLVQNNFDDIEIIGIDTKKERRDEITANYNVKSQIQLSPEDYKNLDAVFVCSSPLSHEKIIKEAIQHKVNVFTEINLINNYYDDIIKISEENNIKIFLSSTFLYRKEIEYIKNLVSFDNKITYMYHVGQYLPDWHPWESYESFFVNNVKTNAVRELFAIELPWIIDVFGPIEKIKVEKRKISKLNINFPDSYSLILNHQNGVIGTLNVDVVSRKAKRNLNIIGELTQVSWNGTPDSLEKWSNQSKNMEKVNLYDNFDHDTKYAKNIIEDAYLEEIKEFFSIIKGDVNESKYSIEKDKIIIDWIDKIEK